MVLASSPASGFRLGTRRHHRPPGFRQIYRHHRQAGGCDQSVGRHRARLHRPRRPHQPAQGADEICHRRHGAWRNSLCWSRRSSATPLRACRRKRWRRGRQFDRMAHIGVHKQKQEGLNWIGVALPLGKVTCEQMRGLAKIAQDLGDGDIRLTVWQNLLIPGVRDDNVALATAAIEAIGLAIEDLATPRRPDRLHRPRRLQIRPCRHQAHGRQDRRLVRSARADRDADQHPSDRLPPFLRAALHQRYRHDRRAHSRSAIPTTRSMAFISSRAAASVRTPMSGRRCFTTSRRRTRLSMSSGC